MSVVYACTRVSKRIERDRFETGLDPSTVAYTMHEACNVEAPNLEALLDQLRQRYSLPLDDIYLPDSVGECPVFTFTQREDADCNPIKPNTPQSAAFKAGTLDAWLCDYEFTIEKRHVVAIRVDEFRNVVKTYS